MSVIAKISSYFERHVVTLKLRKEYLNTVTYNTPCSLTPDKILNSLVSNATLCQHIRELQTSKTVRFFGPPCIYNRVLQMLWELFQYGVRYEASNFSAVLNFPPVLAAVDDLQNNK